MSAARNSPHRVARIMRSPDKPEPTEYSATGIGTGGTRPGYTPSLRFSSATERRLTAATWPSDSSTVIASSSW